MAGWNYSGTDFTFPSVRPLFVYVFICLTDVSHLFERELKLSRVQQELEQDPGVVPGVVEHLVFDLT